MVQSIKEDYLSLLRKLILNYVAGHSVQVFLFGSRAKKTSHKTSDVDIALLPQGQLPTGFIASLKELIEESTIPFQVDIVDLSQTDHSFRDKILEEGILWSD